MASLQQLGKAFSVDVISYKGRKRVNCVSKSLFSSKCLGKACVFFFHWFKQSLFEFMKIWTIKIIV